MKNPEVISDMMFSNGSVDSLDATPEVLMLLKENSRVKKIARRALH